MSESNWLKDLFVEEAKAALSRKSSGGGGGGGNIDALIDGSITEITSNVETLKQYALYECKSLTKASFPNATTIQVSAISACPSLRSLSLPNVTKIETGGVSLNTALESISLPKAIDLSNYNSIFANCSALKNVDLPICTRLGANAFKACTSLEEVCFSQAYDLSSSIFDSCSALKRVELLNNSGKTSYRINSYAFKNCYSLKTLILRQEVCTALYNTNVFNGCYHFLGTVDATYNPDGLKDGYIYVPSSVIETYKSATNWSAFASQFRVLEDYTVDGTITGALDESKI